MARFIALVILPGERTANLDKKLDLAMGQQYFSTFFLEDHGQKFHLPAGSYHHDQPDVYQIPEEAHAAATRAAQSVDPLAAVVIFPFNDVYYAGESRRMT